MATRTSRLRLDRLIGVAALAAVFSFPMARVAIAAAAPAVPPGLQPALYSAMAKEAGPAYAIGRDGCAKLAQQQLTACFGKGGVRFSGKSAPSVSMHLVSYGRAQAITLVKPVVPTIQGNRASYAHGTVTEWWRVLPVGFEQGFTVAKRPAGSDDLTLELAANRKAAVHGGDLAFGRLDYGKLVVTDAKGHVIPSTLQQKGGRILIAVNDSHAVYPLTVDPLVWVEQKITASDGVTNALFGFSVAVSGTTAVVGAPFSTVGGNFAQGEAYVFTESGGTWNQEQALTASDGQESEEFGWSVALDGATVLVGEPNAFVGLNGYQGAAYVFENSGGTWTQTQKLTASDGATDDYFGYAISTSGTEAIIGAIGATVGGNAGQGAAYLFGDSGGTWSQVQKLTASDGAAFDNFGLSVALDGSTAVVGVPLAVIGSNAKAGAAYVFDNSGGTWTQAQKLTASDGAANEYFGYSVAVAGTNVAAGAYGATVNGNADQGATYIFHESGGTWSQVQKLTASDGMAGAAFGLSVALDGTTLLVGADGTTVGGNVEQGTAYLFDESDGTWSQTHEFTASDGAANDDFGFSVALDGTTALAGAIGATVGGNVAQGAAYIYTATCPQGYSERDATLSAGGLYASTPYQAPSGSENGILGGPGGFQLYAQYSNGSSSHIYRIPGNEIHTQGPAGTYRWGAKAGNTGGAYVLCVLHP